MSEVYRAICRLLDERGIAYRSVQHQPTPTSEEAARARGEDLKIGGKALVLKLKGDFGLFVFSAALRLDSSAVKEHLGVKKLRFATAEELREQTGLVPGSVPPFGPPILPYPLYVDVSITRNARIAFNAGSLTDSIVLSVPDYLEVAKPEIFRFAR